MDTVLRVAGAQRKARTAHIVTAGQQLIGRDAQVDVHLVDRDIESARPRALELQGLLQRSLT